MKIIFPVVCGAVLAYAGVYVLDQPAKFFICFFALVLANYVSVKSEHQGEKG